MSITLSPPAPLRPDLRSEFLLDPTLTFINHGSFGAVAREVIGKQNQWRNRIEADPIEMIYRRWPEHLAPAKRVIGEWLGMNPADFGLVTNATEGANAVLRSLTFSRGDELVTTTHVYNAVRQAMKNACQQSGATYREIEIPLPVESANGIERFILEGLTERTRLLVVDHITSATALIFPVEAIVAKCNQKGIDVLIDGAHAPGMLPLDVSKISPAYYAGNLHKWGCAPKGSAFLWARPDRQANIHPVTVSHYFGQGMEKEFSWQGTRDISAWLATPASIERMNAIGWPRIMSHNHALAAWVNQMLCHRWNVASISPIDGSMLGSMATVPLPPPLDRLTAEQAENFGGTLHDRYRIEVPIMLWSGKAYIRPCCQIYNLAADYERLAETIESMRQQNA
jgi:isopenicillin-N epimerase